MKWICLYLVVVSIIVIAIACGRDSSISDIEVELSPYSIQSSTFNCERLKQSIGNKTFAISFLWNSFGNNNECLKEIFSKDTMGLFEIHSMNHWCLRDGVCDNDREVYRGTPKRFEELVSDREGWLLQKVLDRLSSIKLFLDENPTNATCYISTGLETMLTPKTNDILVELVRNILPNCYTVYNPITPTTERGEADYLEVHGNTVPMSAPCIANLDGVQAIDIDVEAYEAFYTQCDASFLWNKVDNCITPGSFIAPHLRDCN